MAGGTTRAGGVVGRVVRPSIPWPKRTTGRPTQQRIAAEWTTTAGRGMARVGLRMRGFTQDRPVRPERGEESWGRPGPL